MAWEKSTLRNAWRSFWTTCWLEEWGLGEGDDEFVAAVAEGEIGLSQCDADAVGKRLEHMIAGGMAVGVVDLFEVIEVDHHQGQGIVVPFAEGDFALKQLLHRPAIEQAGEGIGQRLLFSFGQKMQAGQG